MLHQPAVPCHCRTFTIERMPTFFKQRDNLWFPAWAFVLPSTIVRFPLSFVESLLWVIFTYFEVGLTLDAGRCGPSCCQPFQLAFLHLRWNEIRRRLQVAISISCYFTHLRSTVLLKLLACCISEMASVANQNRSKVDLVNHEFS